MKFTILAAVAALLAAVSAQSDPAACTLCLQSSLQSLPACTGVEASSSNPAYAACLCASLNGAWIDACSGDSQCGAAIATFRASYASNIQAAGLSCANGQASFTPLA
ncbi:hypothetical protein BG006_010827 [Podila minutissima]|uniref:Extracellular membrane protein CFEM domain-containing protein n=1 Tax=Podila minutissima TaxID=64525 RepID=A0A9P5SCS6_9FUNG|nr:hypothetical protein BG006_010827 [Podila minutissima]